MITRRNKNRRSGKTYKADKRTEFKGGYEEEIKRKEIHHNSQEKEEKVRQIQQ